MFRIDRTPRASSTRRSPRAGPRKAERAGGAQLPVVAGEVVIHAAAPPSGESVFEAQLFGQDGERRGLRAGPSFIEAANHAYNRIKWTGPWDRRARQGHRARAEV